MEEAGILLNGGRENKNEKRDEITNRYQFCDWIFFYFSLPLIPIPLAIFEN